MLGRKTTSGMAALAVGGVLILGGCGGGSDSTNTGATDGATMKHQSNAMKSDGKKQGGGAMKGDDGAMHEEGDDKGRAMHDGSDDHPGAMHGNG